jgi:hypothetical protein
VAWILLWREMRPKNKCFFLEGVMRFAASWIFTWLFVGGAFWGTVWAKPPVCKAPHVLVLFDRSSSMIELLPSGKSKLAVATSALEAALKANEKNVDFGLMAFPDPDQCSPGKLQVPIKTQSAAAILAKLASFPTPPASGNGTPMAQTLGVAAGVKALQDAAFSNHVLLITDGEQMCVPYDPNTRFLPVNAVSNLTALGIKTHVVGFGGEVDALVLNKMAATGGTKVSPSCNDAGTSAAATNNCYYQALSPKQLQDALQAIAKNISSEVCDGLDNDCDGKVDNNLQAPLCDDQDGVCKGATAACGGSAGWQTCIAGDYQAHAHKNGLLYQVDETLCDGRDNDCDGVIDEGCGCIDGETRPCGTDAGVCVKGTQHCVAGVWLGCVGGVTAVPEACDGKDNDCDGKTDEDLARPCSTICGPGEQRCVGGKYDQCDAQLPSKEVCDGEDNDCDGTVDGPDAYCADGGVCVNGECKEVDPNSGQYNPDYDDEGGCDCDVASEGPRNLGALALLLIFGCLIMLSTRRGKSR